MAELIVPALGESITEAVIGKWLKQVGEYVELDEPVVDLETDKVTVQLPAPKAGQLKDQRAAEGQTVRVGDIVGAIDTSATAPTRPKEAKGAVPTPSVPVAAAPETTKRMSSAPANAPKDGQAVPDRGARERPLSPAERRTYRSGEAGAVFEPAKRAEQAREEAVAMSPLRKRIAERLVQAQHETASLTTFNEVDMSAIMSIRKRVQEEFVAKHGIKLGFMSFFAKACVSALRLYPGLNAELRDDSIVYKKHYDLGVAVGTEKGLVVPVLRAIDQLGFGEIEQGISDLAQKARSGKLALDDLMGATFTLTNGGIYGSMMLTPLLNYPQTGILGMHNIVKRAVVIADQVEVRPMMYLALTYDHRVVDGREAVQFLVAVKKSLESPERLLFAL